jgi:hypothetical protein
MCPHRESCELPRAIASPFALLRWQSDYCNRAESRDCERRKLIDSGQAAPRGMLPNGHVLSLLG